MLNTKTIFTGEMTPSHPISNRYKKKADLFSRTDLLE